MQSFSSNDLELATEPTPQPVVQSSGPSLPAAIQDITVLAAGGAAIHTAVKLKAQLVSLGKNLIALGFDSDHSTPLSQHVQLPSGESVEVTLDAFCPVGQGRMSNGTVGRDRVFQYPLLAERYLNGDNALFRGIPLTENAAMRRGTRGGGGIPAFSALDFDLDINDVLVFLRRHLRHLTGEMPQSSAGSALECIIQQEAAAKTQPMQKRLILVLFGITGSSGPGIGALHLPYVTRYVLDQLRVKQVELVGVGLGPNAFMNLTPYTAQNGVATLHMLEYLHRHGYQHEFMNGVKLRTLDAPFTQTFLLDDPAIVLNEQSSAEQGKTSEDVLYQFFNRAARTLRLLFTSGLYEMLMSRADNPDIQPHQPNGGIDPHYRWLSTLRLASLGQDRAALTQLANLKLQQRLLQTLAQRVIGTTS